MFVIGLTGGIGSGKSTVEAIFRELGIVVIEADRLAREVVAPGKPALESLVSELGGKILLADKSLNRRLLRELIFKDSSLRKFVEAVIHPHVHILIQKALKKSKSPYTVLSIPLLFEQNLQYLVNRVLVIDAPLELQIARAMARDEASEADIQGIIATQVSKEERLARADDLINNEGDLETLNEAVHKLHEHYLSLCAKT